MYRRVGKKLKRKRFGTGNDKTRYWPADDQWQGGVCVRDTLGCSINTPTTLYEQTILVDHVPTTPRYLQHFDVTEVMGEGLWKTTLPE